MSEPSQPKKWTSPRLISLGTIAEVEQNDQISEKMKQMLLDLRNEQLENAAKEGTVPPS